MTTLERYAAPGARLTEDVTGYEVPRLLSMRGRLNRGRYLWTSFGIWVGMYAAAIALGLVAGLTNMDDRLVLTGSLGVTLAATILAALQAVKRLHDLDRPGAHYWLLLVPVYNMYLTFLLFLRPGTEGSNDFGADPLSGSPG